MGENEPGAEGSPADSDGETPAPGDQTAAAPEASASHGSTRRKKGKRAWWQKAEWWGAVAAVVTLVPVAAVAAHTLFAPAGPTTVINNTVNVGSPPQPSPTQSSTCPELTRGSGAPVLVNGYVKAAAAGACWSTELSPAQPGEHLRFMVRYENGSGVTQRDVVARLNLPPKMHFVPHTTRVYNMNNPDGLLAQTDALASDGIIIGSYDPSSVAYVTLDVDAPLVGDLECGWTTTTTVLTAHPMGTPETYNTANVRIERGC